MARQKYYKTKFNDYQMAIFNTLDLNGYKRFNLMSVYSYLIKHSIDKLVSKLQNEGVSDAPYCDRDWK